MAFYFKDITTVLKELGSGAQTGLSSAEAQRRLNDEGLNEITDKKRESIVGKFFSQFKDFMIIILLVSAFVSLAVSYFSGEHEYYDFFIILAIVLANGIIGTVQEYRAEKAIEALKKISSPIATIIRNGKKKKVESRYLVRGDIVILTAGDIAPADIRLIDSVELSSEESSLTGESVPSYKSSNIVLNKNTPVSEQKNMLFSGCAISSGHGKGIVCETGMNTQIGKIATLLQKEKTPQTPLQKKLNQTGKILGIVVVVICGIIFALGLFKDIPPLEMLLNSISLAVAAIPEGLTAVVTIVLSVGVKRMVLKKAIVRKLSAVETLGSVNVICSDKTGTLTENKMTVVEVVNTKGVLSQSSEERRLILALASLCNNSEKSPNGKFSGMPTETAIVKAFSKELDDYKKQFPRIKEIPFTSSRKLMTTIHKSGNSNLVITKGAPDYLIKLCTHIQINGDKVILNASYMQKILDLNQDMSKRALRVLAVAKKEIDTIGNNIESNLTFCGLIGIEDPPRKEAKTAVALCKKAGISAVMITGDQVDTAVAIAKKIGIYESGSRHMTGQKLSETTDEELAKIIHNYKVFARVTPEDKVRIVKAFRANGNLIAMTGDGINDAPALKCADIGCAMGKNGTEVAKSAADMVLTDDNFATIVEAVKEGRGIFLNIKKTIHFLLSCNMGEILLIFSSFLLGLPIPLLATQILWVNLVTDSFPALALGSGKSDDSIMERAFPEGKKGILDFQMCFSMIVEGALIGALSLIAFIIGRTYFDIDPSNPVIGRSMCFAVLCLSQLVHSFNVSSEHSIFSKKRKPNKWLTLSAIMCALLLVMVIVLPFFSVAFKTTALTLTQWGIVVFISLMPLAIVEIEKL